MPADAGGSGVNELATGDNKIVFCSFCGRCAEEVDTIVRGEGVAICSKCTTISQDVINRHRSEDAPEPADRAALSTQEGGDHYKNLKIQPVEYIHANGLGFIEGSVIKYVTRWRSKNGIADLRKARHFIDLLIELEGSE